MRGAAATENDVEADDVGGSGGRRPSVVTLQSILKKVSQSPFHEYQTLVSSPSDTSESSSNDSQNKQDGEFLSDLSAAADRNKLHLGQNGGQELLHLNPQESSSKDHIMEEVVRETSNEVNLDTIFVPPPEFQNSSLDLQPEMKTLENGAEFSQLPKDPFQTLTPNLKQGGFQTPTLAQNASANGHFVDVTLNSPDLFKPVTAQTQNLSKTSDLFKDEEVDPFKAASEVNLFDKSPSSFVNPFRSLNKDDPFQSPQTMANPFDTTTTKEGDLFQTGPNESKELFHTKESKQDPSTKDDLFGKPLSKQNLDIFSSSSTNSVDPFPSPVARDLFQDVSISDDPFGTTPSRQYDPFQDVSPGTPDIFQPLPSKTNSSDIFGITPSNTASKATFSTPILNSPSEEKLDMLSSPDLFKATPSESHPAIKPKLPDEPHDIFLTTPQGTEHDILQPSPFTRARNLSMSFGRSPPEMTHVPTFKRPPKPLPRSRPPRPNKPPMPEKPPKPERPPAPAKPMEPEPTVPKTSPKPALRSLPKPVIPRRPKTPESKPVEPVVYEDILLTGQEKCVEDWPEDSPQLNPDFKPSGTLRLRRESLKKKVDSDGGSGEDQDVSGSHSKKKDRKAKLSLLSRRGSKKFADDTKEAKSRTLPTTRKSSKEYFTEFHMSAEEYEDEQNGMDYRKKHLKAKVSQLLRRASTTSYALEGKHMNGHLPQESKGTVLDDSTCEDEEGGEAQHEEKKKKKVKIKFVPHRGFAITVDKGAHRNTPHKGSKDKTHGELLGAHGYTPREKFQDDAFEDVEEMSLQSTSKAAFMDDEHFQKTRHMSAGLNGDEDTWEMEDCKPKKPTKTKLLHGGFRSSKEDMLDDPSHQKKMSSFSAEELDDEDEMEDCKPKTTKPKIPPPLPRKPKTSSGQSEPIGFSYQIPQQASSDPFAEDDFTHTGRDFMKDMIDSEEDELETCKSQKKPSKLKGLKKHKAKSKAIQEEYEDPPGAAPSDFLSEAARAEWLAAQKDEHAIAGLEDEGEDGDTDSLMEWWNTVEQWDEVPSDDEDKVLKEDESKSFTILADKVSRGLRVFNKVFTERAEVLWQSVITLHAIADDINNFHHKAKIAGITGGTTTAVGGVTAIAGLVLAPITLGVSLVITAVGVGVATAGGIASASAAISDNVNNMQDRKKVEIVLDDYEADLRAIGKILHFVNQGLYKLRGHPFLRSGTQHYSKDWEIRRAVQMISLVDSPVMRGAEITDSAIGSVQGLFKGMDKYFIKDSRELKKGCKKEVVAQIKEVANVLNDVVVELNAIREELQDATGNM
ncbi:uncharacterized protein si:cabz01007807.1 isoform X2 [Epinephelus moara]|uniref:uncharacterized protein si:cabz01007807.1 isoform X2 n=1 Tax=Epinephelus moara TaxID=300413 RepID=UPI00214EE13F|nr:uncharacterized protein si:cabz01007807.1 isoform X2 [Epinephelus moara]